MDSITNSSAVRIVLANRNLAGYPEGGGHWACLLQHFLGLLELKHDVFWFELLYSTGDRALDLHWTNAFFERMKAYDLHERSALMLKKPAVAQSLDALEFHGKCRSEIEEIARTADVVWNYASSFDEPLMSMFKRRVLIDLDPGLTQVCAALNLEMGQDCHEVFLTVGSKLADADCEIPKGGKDWKPFPPVLYLPWWKPCEDPGPTAPFTSVAHWNWDEVWFKGRVLSCSKREAYFNYLDLPSLAKRPFELAAYIHPEDPAGDDKALAERGWRLCNPYEVCPSPAGYRRYIQRSRAEFCCAKPIYHQLKTGWISDRSACYLASGRPVLAEETGFSDHFPTGRGLIAFKDMKQAVAGVEEIDSNYRPHSIAARELAEEYFDSRKCLTNMLAACQ